MRGSVIAAAVVLLGSCGPEGGGGQSGAGSTGGGSIDASTSGAAASVADVTGVPEDIGVDPTHTGVPPIMCGHATLVDAWVHIDGGDFDERDALDGVRVIDGSLIITRSSDTDLDFLACIEEITGDLVIHDNDALVDVSKLAAVERLGGDFVVAHNDVLVELDALPSLTEIEREIEPPQIAHGIVIVGNAALERISGLDDLVVVWGNLQVTDNPSLTSIDGLMGVKAVGGDLAINHNPSLCISAVNAVGAEIEQPSPPPSTWTTIGNDEDC